MKFKLKPAVVEAEQWFPDAKIAGVHPSFSPEHRHNRAYIDTLNGRVLVWPGDWVVRSDDGTVFVLGDVSFRQCYEPHVEGDR